VSEQLGTKVCEMFAMCC